MVKKCMLKQKNPTAFPHVNFVQLSSKRNSRNTLNPVTKLSMAVASTMSLAQQFGAQKEKHNYW